MNGGDTVCEGYFYKNVMTFYACFFEIEYENNLCIRGEELVYLREKEYKID
jgi:predicted phosphatase